MFTRYLGFPFCEMPVCTGLLPLQIQTLLSCSVFLEAHLYRLLQKIPEPSGFCFGSPYGRTPSGDKEPEKGKDGEALALSRVGDCKLADTIP